MSSALSWSSCPVTMCNRRTKTRVYVRHDYHDHAFDQETNDGAPVVSDCASDDEYMSSRVVLATKQRRRGPRGGVAVPFPNKLHEMLSKAEVDGHAHIVSWQPHGRCFLLHKPKEFVSEVMPLFFRQSKLTSFQRQLNLYGFCRLTSGPDRGAYYHELFLRGKEFLCKNMIRTRIKGTGIKAASSPATEPNFYMMPPIPSNGTIHEMSLSSSSTSLQEMETPENVLSENLIADCGQEEVKEPDASFSHVELDEKKEQLIESPFLPPIIVSSGTPPPTTSMEAVPVTPSQSPTVLGMPPAPMLPSQLVLGQPSVTPEPPETKVHQDDEVFFEGQRFHYLDSGSMLLPQRQCPQGEDDPNAWLDDMAYPLADWFTA